MVNNLISLLHYFRNSKLLYCLELQPILYEHLVLFSGQGKQHHNKIKCRVFSGSIIKTVTWCLKDFFFSLSSNMTNTRQRMTAPSGNKIPSDLWINFPKKCGLLSENPLSLPLQIHLVDWLEGSIFQDKFYYWWPHIFVYMVTAKHAHSIEWCTISSESATQAIASCH